MNKNPCPKWLVWKDAGDVVDRIKATFVHVTLRPTKRRCYPSGTNAQGYFTLSLAISCLRWAPSLLLSSFQVTPPTTTLSHLS